MFGLGSFVWLLLPLGIVLGWVLATRLRVDSKPTAGEVGAPDGGKLLEAVTDDAINAVGSVESPNPAMAELQLTLGGVFRSRGEIDRAVAVHDRLRTNDKLAESTRDRAVYELAQDHLKAGLMDRAEDLLQQLIERNRETVRSLELLLSIYEQARDWRQAIEVARRLQGVKAHNYGPLLAHYHCELAEQVQEEKPEKAQRLARRALDLCPDSVRASLLLGSLAEKQADPVAALRAYRRVPEQDARFLPEVIPALERCSQALGKPQMFAEFIEEAEGRFPESGSVMLARARLLGEQRGDVAAYLAEHLARHPQWPGLLAWIDAKSHSDANAAGLGALRDALRKRLQSRPGYRCVHCGLTPSLLFWQCPGCKQWDGVVPDEDRL